MSEFPRCKSHPKEIFTSECPSCLKLLNEQYLGQIREQAKTIEGMKKQIYEVDTALINGRTEEIREERDAALLQVNELRKLMGHWSTVELALKAQEETNRLNGELRNILDACAQQECSCYRRGATLCGSCRARNLMAAEKPKCVCGGIGLGVACEPGCPNCALKRVDEGGNPWAPNKDVPAPTKPINENQPAFIQTPMGFGCRNCGRPPGGAGGCLICQRY